VFGGLSAKQREKLARKAGRWERYEDLRQYTTPMTQDRIDVILKYWREGYSLADIEELTGINRGSVSRVIKNPEHNPEAPPVAKQTGYRFQKNWESAKYKEVRELLNQGFNTMYIHRATGFHWKTIRRIRYSMNLAQTEKLCNQEQ